MCEETFFSPCFAVLREVQRHCRFLWCPEVSRPATVGWKTAPPTDSPGPAPSLQDPQDCHIAEVWNFTTDLESVKTEIVSVTSRTQSVTLFCWRENAAVTRIRVSCRERPPPDTRWLRPPSPSFPPLGSFVRADWGRVYLPGWFPFRTQRALLCSSKHVGKE